MPRFVIAPDGQAFNPEHVVSVGLLDMFMTHPNGMQEYRVSVRCERFSMDTFFKGTKEECTILRNKFIKELNSKLGVKQWIHTFESRSLLGW